MLLEPSQAAAFLVAAVLITLSPGPDNMMVLSMGATRGRASGVAFGLGCASGCLTHTLLAALGISALIAASPVAFTALKVLGGLYLIYLGWGAIRSRSVARVSTAALAGERPLHLFRRGVIANSINPKVVMFFLAFLPQFVVAGQGGTAVQILQLGVLFTLQAAVLFGTLGYFAGTIGSWLNRTEKAGAWLDRIAGAIFISLGLKLIFTR